MATYDSIRYQPGTVRVYANLAAFPSSGNAVGDHAFATNTKALYVRFIRTTVIAGYFS